MNTTISISTESPKVFFKDGRLVTTSQSVADYFDKQHKDVLRKIDTLDCSPEFTSANFCADVQTIGIGNGAERETRCFLITKDGFMFLVMGFTGKKAARLKEAYIAKFNKMEAELSKPVTQPGYSELVITLQNGQPVCSRVGQPGEFMSTLEGHTEMLRRAGYVITHCDDLELLTVADLAKRADEARQLMNKWMAITNS
ncbi:TPA: Rha family transcriptional regulator [Salmonella enterica subsp. salamae serovar 30:g,m,s:e,n,x]|nr:Rha family transcriptional regulator [Salmonella enterica subsp. salamae serovar 30:g,m,s:e,n,x]